MGQDLDFLLSPESTNNITVMRNNNEQRKTRTSENVQDLVENFTKKNSFGIDWFHMER